MLLPSPLIDFLAPQYVELRATLNMNVNMLSGVLEFYKLYVAMQQHQGSTYFSSPPSNCYFLRTGSSCGWGGKNYNHAGGKGLNAQGHIRA